MKPDTGISEQHHAETSGIFFHLIASEFVVYQNTGHIGMLRARFPLDQSLPQFKIKQHEIKISFSR
jgi:hypothetical protein